MADIALFDDTERNIQAAAREAGEEYLQLLKINMDVTDRASVNAAGNLPRNQFGRLGILINNVPLLDTNVEPILQTYQINIRGT